MSRNVFVGVLAALVLVLGAPLVLILTSRDMRSSVASATSQSSYSSSASKQSSYSSSASKSSSASYPSSVSSKSTSSSASNPITDLAVAITSEFLASSKGGVAYHIKVRNVSPDSLAIALPAVVYLPLQYESFDPNLNTSNTNKDCTLAQDKKNVMCVTPNIVNGMEKEFVVYLSSPPNPPVKCANNTKYIFAWLKSAALVKFTNANGDLYSINNTSNMLPVSWKCF